MSSSRIEASATSSYPRYVWHWLYAPDDAPLDRVVTLYQQAKRYIYVSVYGLTYPRAVEALVAAKKRGVDVRMLTDQERTQDFKQYRALQTLRLAGIPIRVSTKA